jgi:hypothetical protein
VGFSVRKVDSCGAIFIDGTKVVKIVSFYYIMALVFILWSKFDPEKVSLRNDLCH